MPSSADDLFLLWLAKSEYEPVGRERYKKGMMLAIAKYHVVYLQLQLQLSSGFLYNHVFPKHSTSSRCLKRTCHCQ